MTRSIERQIDWVAVAKHRHEAALARHRGEHLDEPEEWPPLQAPPARSIPTWLMFDAILASPIVGGIVSIAALAILRRMNASH